MGKGQKPMSHFCLAELTREYIARPYALGDRTGLDCFSLIYDYMIRVGNDLPMEWRGLTLDNYAELFKQDPAEAKRVMVEFVDEHCREIKPGMAFAGDLLLLQLRDSDALPFLAIHGGQSMAIASAEDFGVRPWNLGHYIIRRAWRCLPQSR